MKPVRIFSHTAHNHPVYLYEYLERRKIPYEIIHGATDELIASQHDEVSGLVFLGSPVSVNDDLSWITTEIELIKDAIERDIPIMGICFGAQLMTKALGGEVCSTNTMQIGWHQLHLTALAKKLFAIPEPFNAFEWHGDTFDLPDGATPLFTNRCVENQGYLFQCNLALQFHPEISEPMIKEWIEQYPHCLEQSHGCTQNKAQMMTNIHEYLTRQRSVADQLFGWWVDQIRHRP